MKGDAAGFRHLRVLLKRQLASVGEALLETLPERAAKGTLEPKETAKL